MRLPLLCFAAMLALVAVTAVAAPSYGAAYCYVQGSIATISFSTYTTTEYVSVPIIGKFLALVNTSKGTYVSPADSYLEILTLSVPNNVTVTYVTELAELQDGTYVAEFYNPYETLTVVLPSNAVVLEVSTLEHMYKSGEFYNLVFSEGRVRIVYTFLESGPKQGLGTLWAVAGGVSVAGAVAAYMFFRVLRRRVKRGKELEALDERDRAIIEALESGPKTPQELIRATDMSKATFYRRIKRLIDLGYIEQIKKEGKVFYRLKEED